LVLHWENLEAETLVDRLVDTIAESKLETGGDTLAIW